MMFGQELYTCPICNRKHSQERMSWHHLLPSVGKIEKSEPRIYVCVTCHSVIHFCHTNLELREKYNTLDRIIESNLIISLVKLYKYKKDNVTIKIKKLKQLLKTA
jgi:hypothetical protein